jgi:hypothetical protein
MHSSTTKRSRSRPIEARGAWRAQKQEDARGQQERVGEQEREVDAEANLRGIQTVRLPPRINDLGGTRLGPGEFVVYNAARCGSRAQRRVETTQLQHQDQ